MKTTNKLYEDLGSVMRHHGPAAPTRNQPQGQRQQQTFDPNQDGPNIPPSFVAEKNLQGVELFKFNFQNWQNSIIGALHNGNNIYVVASPGAGKTAPIMYYWADKVLGVNPGMRRPNSSQAREVFKNIVRLLKNPEEVPKLLYLCPIRQLVYSIQNEFREYLAQVILYVFNFVITTNIGEIQILIDFFSKQEEGHNQRLKSLYNKRSGLIDEYNRFSQLNNNRASSIQKDIENLDKEIQDRVAQTIRQFIDRKLLHIKTGVDSFPSNSSPAVMVCVYQSGENLYHQFKKDIRIIIMDEAHTAQRSLEDRQKNPKERQSTQITNNIYPIIKQSYRNNNQLILLSGTVHPTSAKNLINYIKTCLGVDINIKEVSDSGNASDISVIPMDELQNQQTLIKLLTNPKENGNLIAIFSKKKIRKLAELALKEVGGQRFTAQQIDRGDLQSAKRGELGINLKDEDRFQPNDGPQARGSAPDSQVKFGEEMLQKIKENPSVGKIQDDELLMKCLLSGFGYIFRQDDDDMSNQEKQVAGNNQKIVAEMFSQGKIHTILATHAVGVGLNMKIKSMYVPKATRFDGTKDIEIPLSDASQFYNRVGRMAFSVSSIYTPEPYVDTIVKAISATNRQYDERETVINMNKAICVSKKPFRTLWRSAMTSVPEPKFYL